MENKVEYPNQIEQPNREAREFLGMFETVTDVPTKTPRNFINQIKFYSSGTTYRLYMYDIKNNVWRYTTLT
jgi:glycine cleavage system pyridoxal-binding protein P